MHLSKLSTQLLGLVLLPTAGLLFFGVKLAHERWGVYRDYSALERNSAVLRQIGHTVHELQKERGRSSGFLNSQGRQFGGELQQQRTLSDRELTRIEGLLAGFDTARFGERFARQLEAAQAAWRGLAAKRRAIDALQLTPADSLDYYSETIAAMLGVVVAMSHLSKDAETGDGIQGYVNFLQAKEQAGIERATLSAVFAVDAFTADTLRRFNRIAATQDTYLRVFESFADEEQKRFHAEKVAGGAVEKVAQMRAVAVEKAASGGFGVAAAAWFDASTARINLMKEVEDRLAADYSRRADEIRRAARAEFIFDLAVVALIGVVTAAATALLARRITKRLLHVASKLMQGADDLAEAATQGAAASQQQAAGVSEQAASLEETSASLEEISSMTKRNAVAATEAKSLSGQTRAAADTGSSDMAEMMRAMDALKSSSANIAKIVKSIDEIAFQTNILALNAAVEAARAGEAGAGFAVVAEEVRALAQRSALAAKETAEKLDESVRNGDSGVRISRRIAEHFQAIVHKAHQVDTLVGEIASASQEQKQGIEQVSMAVVQMDKVTQSGAAGSEETAAQAEQLSAQVRDMNAAVGQLMEIVGGRRRGDLHGRPGEKQASGRRESDRERAAPAPRTNALPPLPAESGRWSRR